MSKLSDSLNNFWNAAVKPIKQALETHAANTTNHVTAAEKETWNSAAAGGLYVYSFAAEDWDTTAHTITLAAATHGLTGSDVLFRFWHLVDGTYLPGTWACIESWAEIDATTHVITLHGPDEGYAGKVVLSG